MSTTSVTRRLSHRRGSMVAPDPFLTEPVQQPVSSSSRITIVRVPGAERERPTPPSPGLYPQKDATYATRNSDRDPSNLARRSSWGSNRSSSSGSGGGGVPGRFSFAFSSFTPINPTAPGPSPGGGGQGSNSGPPSPTTAFGRSKRSNSNPSLAQLNMSRPASLTPQQLYDLAQQATNPNATPSTPSSPVYGYGGRPTTPGGTPHTPSLAPFTALPSEVYLPFIHRPQEVSQLFSTPPTNRLFGLLASTFPQAPISRPSSRASLSHMSTSSTTSTMHLADLPEDPKTWSFGQLSFWIKCVNRNEANDREWVHKIRICINTRSEVLWQRFAGALGVPAGFDEEEEDTSALEDDYDDAISVGRVTQDAATAAPPEKPVEDEVQAEMDLASTFEDFDDAEESGVVVEPIMASSFNPTASPTVGLGLMAGSGVPPSGSSLRGVQEELEEDEGAFKGNSRLMEDIGEGEESEETSANGSRVTPKPVKSPPPHLLGPHLRDHSPRASSPLASPSNHIKAEGETENNSGRGSSPLGAHKKVEGEGEPVNIVPPTPTKPKLNLTTPTPDPSVDGLSAGTLTKPPSEVAAESESGGVDFTDADLAGEPIQGLRISNAPMMFVVGGGSTPNTAPPTAGLPGPRADGGHSASSSMGSTTPHRFSQGAFNSLQMTPSTPSPGPGASSGASSTTPPVAVPGQSTPYQRQRNTSTGSSQGVNMFTHRNPSMTSLPGVATITYSTQTHGRPEPQGAHDMMFGGGALSHGAYQERGPGSPLFPSSFAGLSLTPTLSANNPSMRYPSNPPASAYPHWTSPSGHYIPRLGGSVRRNRRPSWAEGFDVEGNDYAVTVASGSSDAGRG